MMKNYSRAIFPRFSVIFKDWKNGRYCGSPSQEKWIELVCDVSRENHFAWRDAERVKRRVTEEIFRGEKPSCNA